MEFEFLRAESGMQGLRELMSRPTLNRPVARDQVSWIQDKLTKLDAELAASDSPSQSESEKPSEHFICDAGVPGGAPRKVWAVQLGRVVEGVFSSRDAVTRHLAGVRFPADFTVTEYEVADA